MQKKPQTGVLVKRSYNKVYHFDKINQFSGREIPEQSVSAGSDPKLIEKLSRTFFNPHPPLHMWIIQLIYYIRTFAFCRHLMDQLEGA
jgi:hypothetical protein